MRIHLTFPVLIFCFIIHGVLAGRLKSSTTIIHEKCSPNFYTTVCSEGFEKVISTVSNKWCCIQFVYNEQNIDEAAQQLIIDSSSDDVNENIMTNIMIGREAYDRNIETDDATKSHADDAADERIAMSADEAIDESSLSYAENQIDSRLNGAEGEALHQAESNLNADETENELGEFRAIGKGSESFGEPTEVELEGIFKGFGQDGEDERMAVDSDKIGDAAENVISNGHGLEDANFEVQEEIRSDYERISSFDLGNGQEPISELQIDAERAEQSENFEGTENSIATEEKSQLTKPDEEIIPEFNENSQGNQVESDVDISTRPEVDELPENSEQSGIENPNSLEIDTISSENVNLEESQENPDRISQESESLIRKEEVAGISEESAENVENFEETDGNSDNPQQRNSLDDDESVPIEENLASDDERQVSVDENTEKEEVAVESTEELSNQGQIDENKSNIPDAVVPPIKNDPEPEKSIQPPSKSSSKKRSKMNQFNKLLSKTSQKNKKPGSFQKIMANKIPQNSLMNRRKSSQKSQPVKSKFPLAFVPGSGSNREALNDAPKVNPNDDEKDLNIHGSSMESTDDGSGSEEIQSEDSSDATLALNNHDVEEETVTDDTIATNPRYEQDIQLDDANLQQSDDSSDSNQVQSDVDTAGGVKSDDNELQNDESSQSGTNNYENDDEIGNDNQAVEKLPLNEEVDTEPTDDESSSREKRGALIDLFLDALFN